MKKSDMTFSPYQLELLGDFYRSNFSVSRFVVPADGMNETRQETDPLLI